MRRFRDTAFAEIGRREGGRSQKGRAGVFRPLAGGGEAGSGASGAGSCVVGGKLAVRPLAPGDFPLAGQVSSTPERSFGGGRRALSLPSGIHRPAGTRFGPDGGARFMELRRETAAHR
jgi:hypothetical protein